MKIYELAILARATWELHSLNNEGSIGNVIEPRTLKLADGSISDGVSGEMLKHIHATNVWELESNKNNFCEGCKNIDPTRAEQNQQVRQKVGAQAMMQALEDCVLCDLHGFLVQKPTIHRDSPVQFGWAATLRGQYPRDIHQHARHAISEVERTQTNEPVGKGTDEKREFNLKYVPAEDTLKIFVDGAEQRSGADYTLDVEAHKVTFTTPPPKDSKVTASYSYGATSQMLYSRPTRSGEYAVVTLLQPWRISLNTLNYQYAPSVNRADRFKLALKAYRTMFWRTDGSMTSTRLPHLESFSGVVVTSNINLPVPVLSPLKDNYRNEIANLITASGESALQVLPFDDLAGFVSILNDVADYEPYALTNK